MGIVSTPEVQPGPLQPGLQIAAPKTEAVPALPAPALRRRHLREQAGSDDPGDVDALSAELKGGPPEPPQDFD